VRTVESKAFPGRRRPTIFIYIIAYLS